MAVRCARVCRARTARGETRPLGCWSISFMNRAQRRRMARLASTSRSTRAGLDIFATYIPVATFRVGDWPPNGPMTGSYMRRIQSSSSFTSKAIQARFSIAAASSSSSRARRNSTSASFTGFSCQVDGARLGWCVEVDQVAVVGQPVPADAAEARLVVVDGDAGRVGGQAVADDVAESLRLRPLPAVPLPVAAPAPGAGEEDQVGEAVVAAVLEDAVVGGDHRGGDEEPHVGSGVEPGIAANAVEVAGAGVDHQLPPLL